MSLFTDSQSSCTDIREKFDALEAMDLAGLDPTGALAAAVSDLHGSCNTGLSLLAGHLNTTPKILSGGDKPPQ